MYQEILAHVKKYKIVIGVNKMPNGRYFYYDPLLKKFWGQPYIWGVKL